MVLALDVPSLGVPLGPSVRERGALQLAIGPGTMVIHITLSDLEKQSWVTDNMCPRCKGGNTPRRLARANRAGGDSET